MSGNYNQKIYGDYQTPSEFTDIVSQYLKKEMQLSPTTIIEPTCGIGNFLYSSSKYFHESSLIGIDINPQYIAEAKSRLKSTKTTLFNSNLFEFDFSSIYNKSKSKDETLILGNPPWVNNSTLSSLRGNNYPIKSNFKELKGIEAITGSANFDICEYMILSLIEKFKNTNTVIAMLCKTTVARNVFKELKRTNTFFTTARMVTFNAKKVFDVSVDGCLFIVRLTDSISTQDNCDVYDISNPNKLITSFGYNNGNFYSTLDNYTKTYDGKCCFEWRQGVKHDCSKIMELTKNGNIYINSKNEVVDIEEDFVFPLVKSSHIKNILISSTRKFVIVTQKKVREDTSQIEKIAPKTWKYLLSNKKAFDNRKSSIYNKSPQFSMFGIGDYSYAKFKVGLSGFYKDCKFALLFSDKPIMMDDTCYFLSFSSYELAYIVMIILNNSTVQQFIKSISFLDSKRPYTKKVLERIDFAKCTDNLSVKDLIETESLLGLKPFITQKRYTDFIQLIKSTNSKL